MSRDEIADLEAAKEAVIQYVDDQSLVVEARNLMHGMCVDLEAAKAVNDRAKKKKKTVQRIRLDLAHKVLDATNILAKRILAQQQEAEETEKYVNENGK